MNTDPNYLKPAFDPSTCSSLEENLQHIIYANVQVALHHLRDKGKLMGDGKPLSIPEAMLLDRVSFACIILKGVIPTPHPTVKELVDKLIEYHALTVNDDEQIKLPWGHMVTPSPAPAK